MKSPPPNPLRSAHRHSGFSLLEMLVSLAVIATLATLLIPSISSGIRAGREAKCIGNLRQLYQAYILYINDNDGRIPLYSGVSPDGMSDGYWHRRLQSYVNNDFGATPPKTPVFLCPLDKTPLSGTLSYGMNESLAGLRSVQIQNNLIVLSESSWYLLQNPGQVKKNYKNTANVVRADGSVQSLSVIPSPSEEPKLWKPF